ncbi:hypothetical protein JVT61DRAFT_9100 [Boletus reticuloceps]|uniref:Uncharacterized protein n=1 Tax=Boletus reticuloceps TaxID=495285 RepID=A0A8I2YGQ9_9AGAM|nr:hypothetical protein JVT61DRAFT_9100 [Boletus reticuloceps]
MLWPESVDLNSLPCCITEACEVMCRCWSFGRQPKQFRHRQCQDITTCFLGIDRPPPIGANRLITLPCLQTFRVRRLSPDAYAADAIDPLILPQPQTLEIDAFHLVIRRQCSHHSNFSDLSIQDADFPNDEFIRSLALSPALTSFPCPRSRWHLEMDVSWGDLILTRERRNGHVAHAGSFVSQLREVSLASSVEGYLEELMISIPREDLYARIDNWEWLSCV